MKTTKMTDEIESKTKNSHFSAPAMEGKIATPSNGVTENEVLQNLMYMNSFRLEQKSLWLPLKSAQPSRPGKLNSTAQQLKQQRTVQQQQPARLPVVCQPGVKSGTSRNPFSMMKPRDETKMSESGSDEEKEQREGRSDEEVSIHMSMKNN